MPVGLPPPTATFRLVAAWAGATDAAMVTVAAASDQPSSATLAAIDRNTRPRRFVSSGCGSPPSGRATLAALRPLSLMPVPLGLSASAFAENDRPWPRLAGGNVLRN